jgi:hypothetical protein
VPCRYTEAAAGGVEEVDVPTLIRRSVGSGFDGDVPGDVMEDLTREGGLALHVGGSGRTATSQRMPAATYSWPMILERANLAWAFDPTHSEAAYV